MQYDKQYDGVVGHKALSLSPTLCDRVVSDGELLWKATTSYRGEILLVAKYEPHIERSGCTIALATLREIRKEGSFYRWIFDDMRRVVEFPCRKIGVTTLLWDAWLDKDDVWEYPKYSIRQWLNLEKLK